MLRVVIDTNLWVSFALNPLQSNVRTILLNQEIELLTSEEQVVELSEVLRRPKFKKWLGENDVVQFLRMFEAAVLPVKVTSKVTVCRDPKDNFLLSLSKDGNADYLLTGDADLLVLDVFGKTRICTIRAFTEI
jgi:hypothetical protein